MDFNRDRIPDLVIGVHSARGSARRGLYLQRERRQPATHAAANTREQFAQFGAALCVANDLTGDRRPDVVVGAPGENVSALLQAGAITVFDGRSGRIAETINSAACRSGGRCLARP